MTGSEDPRERRADDERWRAVLRYGQRMRWLVWAMILIAVSSAVASTLINRRAYRLAHRNCELLVKTIKDSGAGGMPVTIAKPKKGQALTPAQAAQRRQEILVSAIVTGLLSAAQRRELLKLNAIIRKAGGIVMVPDCDDPDKTLRVELRAER